MNINEFVHRRRAAWERYRTLLELIESRNYRALTPDEIEEFAMLYRGLSADLAAARTHFPDADLTHEINGLVSRGYSYLYTAGPNSFTRLVRFFTHGYPEHVMKHARVITFSTALFLFFTFVGFVAQGFDHRIAEYMVERPVIEQFEQTIGEQGYADRDIPFSARSMFSSYLMTNNIRVSFIAFAGGILFGLLTLFIVIKNAMVLGVLGRLFADHGLTINFMAFILPHGVIELSAIMISAAAGLMLGYSLINPGDMPRGRSLRRAAMEAIKLMFGVVPMLVIAGFIEAYITPIQWIPDPVKVLISAVILAAFLLYLMSPLLRKKRETPEAATTPLP